MDVDRQADQHHSPPVRTATDPRRLHFADSLTASPACGMPTRCTTPSRRLSWFGTAFYLHDGITVSRFSAHHVSPPPPDTPPKMFHSTILRTKRTNGGSRATGGRLTPGLALTLPERASAGPRRWYAQTSSRWADHYLDRRGCAHFTDRSHSRLPRRCCYGRPVVVVASLPAIVDLLIDPHDTGFVSGRSELTTGTTYPA